MIWSAQELARLAVCKDDVIADKVFSHLSDPDNEDIWKEENFSLLFGLLGVAGVKGVASKDAEKIWALLNDNKVLDAYDKGVLDDFNRRLIQQYKDERMRGWINLDNYTAGLKFRKTILLPLAKLSDKIRSDMDATFPNPDKIIEQFVSSGEMMRLKAYLENIKPIVNDETQFGIDVIFDKEQGLKKLSKAVAYMSRPLTEAQKNYLWYYYFDALNKGFQPQNIEMTDQMLAHLVAEPAGKHESELNVTLLQSRNESIYEFVQMVENTDNFYEETTAKMILFNPNEISWAVAKCLDFAKLCAYPKGVVLALALVNLKQMKSAVTVLGALAEKGAATEACAYMHRLLPLAKGGESVILDFLKENLLKLKKRSVLVQNEAYQTYVSRYYLLAAKGFVDVKCFSECAELLAFISKEAWFAPKTTLADDFKVVGNYLLSLDSQSAALLEPVVGTLGFTVFYDQGKAFIGEGVDNPLTQARHRVEQSIKEATTFDVSGVLDKVATVESGAYNVLKNLKKNLKKDNEAVSSVEQQAADIKTVEEMPLTEPETPTEEITHWEEPKEMPQTEHESIIGGLKRFKNKIGSKVNLDMESILNISALDIDKHFEKIKQAADSALNQAKEQINEVKEKVEHIDVSSVSSIGKMRNFAKKFQIKRKKNE